MRSTAQMIIACEFDSATHEEINSFVKSYSEVEDVWDCSLFEVYSNDVGLARTKLAVYLRTELPSFQVDSLVGEMACRSELKLQIERLLNKLITQEVFREFFLNIENQLIFQETDFDLKFFGDLYNACDSFDQNWNFTPNDYLLEEAARVHKVIEIAEQGASPNH